MESCIRIRRETRRQKTRLACGTKSAIHACSFRHRTSASRHQTYGEGASAHPSGQTTRACIVRPFILRTDRCTSTLTRARARTLAPTARARHAHKGAPTLGPPAYRGACWMSTRAQDCFKLFFALLARKLGAKLHPCAKSVHTGGCVRAGIHARAHV